MITTPKGRLNAGRLSIHRLSRRMTPLIMLVESVCAADTAAYLATQSTLVTITVAVSAIATLTVAGARG